MHGLGWCKVHGLRVRVVAVMHLQRLANNIDRVKNAQAGIVQDAWD